MTWFKLPGLTTIKADQKSNEDIIYLDFGHGGSDSGCLFYDGTKEKNYNLKFGMAVFEIIKKYNKNIKVTRATDKTVTLYQRSKEMSEIAKDKNIDVYSIHCNAYNKTSRGAEICLSVSLNESDKDFVWAKQYLKDYCNEFAVLNRGIIQKKSKSYPGKDYYHIIRETPKNCKVKIIELMFGDNRDDCKKLKNKDYFDKAVFFTASYILKRHNIIIPSPIADNIEKEDLYYIQVGAFKDKKNALELAKKVAKNGFDVYVKEK